MPTMATQDEREGIEHKEEQSKKEGQKKKEVMRQDYNGCQR